MGHPVIQALLYTFQHTEDTKNVPSGKRGWHRPMALEYAAARERHILALLYAVPLPRYYCRKISIQATALHKVGPQTYAAPCCCLKWCIAYCGAVGLCHPYFQGGNSKGLPPLPWGADHTPCIIISKISMYKLVATIAAAKVYESLSEAAWMLFKARSWILKRVSCNPNEPVAANMWSLDRAQPQGGLRGVCADSANLPQSCLAAGSLWPDNLAGPVPSPPVHSFAGAFVWVLVLL